jgi:aminoglycoside 3-N-acetyltransferase
MTMLSFRNLVTSFQKLDLGQSPVIVHASLSAFGPVQGGADTLVGALLSSFSGVIMPTFTYRTMITPEIGPPDNGITYGTGSETNLTTEFFRPDMPVDKLLGIIPETLRRHPKAVRSNHPIYSFTGVNSEPIIRAQSLDDPFGPIGMLTANGGWVLLLGVDHTANTSIHYAEQIAGRRQFIRWALTPQGIIACPGWPGCSYGFNQANPSLEKVTKTIVVGKAVVRAYPLEHLVGIVIRMIQKDPFALLCNNMGCERCNAVRKTHAVETR